MAVRQCSSCRQAMAALADGQRWALLHIPAGMAGHPSQDEVAALAARQGQPCRHYDSGRAMPMNSGGSVGGYRQDSAARLPRLKVRQRQGLLQPWQDKRQRQAVMAAARVREQHRRQAVRRALAGLAALLGQAEQGQAVPYWQPTGALLAALKDAAQDWRTWRYQSEAVMVDALAGNRAGRQWAFVMIEGHGRQPDARGSDPWQSSPMKVQPCYGIRVSPAALAAGMTRQAVRQALAAGMGWRLIPAGQGSTGKRRQRGTVIRGSEQRRAAALAAAGTIRMGEQD